MMVKRPSLRGDVPKPAARTEAALQAADRLDKAARTPDAERQVPDRTAKGRPLTTTITIDWDTLEVLRLVAMRRAHKAGGGRPSVSNVVQDLIAEHIEDLRREAGM